MKDTAIENLEERLRQAMLNSDLLMLDELIAEDLVFTMHTGLLINKQADLEAYRSGRQKLTKLNSHDRQIHHYGDCAVVTVKMALAGTYNEQAFSGNYRYTRVWAKQQQRWQVVAGHVSQVTLL